MIVAAFMRERAAPPAPKPGGAVPAATAPPPSAIHAAAEPGASAGPKPPVAAATLLEAAAPVARVDPRTRLTAPAVPRWMDEVEPPPSPRPSSRARPLLLALGVVALAGLALAWHMELAPKPQLRIDWARVQAVTSPHVGPASASEGSRLAVVVRETTPSDAAGAPPIVFPNVAPQAEPPVAPAPAPSSPAPAVAAPVVEPPAPVAAIAPVPIVPSPTVTLSVPAADPAPVAATSAAETSARPTPSAPAVQAAAAPSALPLEPPQASPPAPAAAPSVEPAPRDGNEERIAELLAQARRLALAFALTTPPGQSAYDSYREVLSIEPGRREALAGLDEIAAKYDDLAGLGRQRDKPALVQLYENRAAQVRRERARLASEIPPPQGASR